MDGSLEPSDELFTHPPGTLPVHATVGDVINLDSVSQDSVPLDDTASAEGIIMDTDTTEEEGAGGPGKSEDEPVPESGPTESEEGSPKAKIGSPKPFDASLFGGTGRAAADVPSESEFPIKAPIPSSSTPDADKSAEDEEVLDSSKSGTLAMEVQRQTSKDGFESQPIGSPGSYFQFSDSDSPFAEVNKMPNLVPAETVTTQGAQPAISSFFDEEGVEAIGDTEAKSFFDSFTSGGDGFPQSVSVESPRAEDDTSPMLVGETLEVNLQPLGQGSPTAKPADIPASTKAGPSEDNSLEDAKSTSSSTKKTLLDLARQSTGPDGAQAESVEQTLGPQSPLTEVTSPHLCKVQNQAEGEPIKVAFTKTNSAAPRPNVLEGQDRPAAPPSESLGTTSESASQQLSPVEAHQSPVQPQTPPQPQLFASLSPSQTEEDIFAAAISTSHSDRRHDAWLPSSATQKVLANRMLALQGTEFVDRAQLTMPGIVLEDPQGDPVKELLYRYVGEAEAGKRVALTADQVTRDEAGLKKLLDSGCLRAAVDLTGLMLTAMGQGKGQGGMPSKHNLQSLQIWLTRLALLVKLQQYSMAEVECEAFDDLDRPDLYFEYYPDLYPGRQGTMVPFSFRVLHAELPTYVGKYQDSLNRLYHLLDITRKILLHLESGLSEYGTEIELTEDNRTASLDLWKSREVRVLYSIGNCLLSMKDYNQAVSVYESLLLKDSKNASMLLSGIGRIFLQLGDLKAAQEAYNRAEASYNGAKDVPSQSIVLMNKAFMYMAQNQYPEARKTFDALLEIDPQNFTAINNQSVCLLYMGKLKEALAHLETLVRGDPSRYLDEGLLFNLCTLYELESSRSTHKKQTLLGLVSQHRGDGFNVGCLKML